MSIDVLMAIEHKIDSIVLAAGKGTRAGGPKALLRLNNTTFVEYIINKLLHAPVARIIVVTRPEIFNEIKTIALSNRVLVILNSEDKGDQLSSIRVGLKHASDDSTGFICWPVDIPMVKTGTIHSLITTSSSVNKNIILPKYNNKRGHPVIFKKNMYHALSSLCPAESGARWLIHQYPREILELEVNDPGILLNVNTPEELALIHKLHALHIE